MFEGKKTGEEQHKPSFQDQKFSLAIVIGKNNIKKEQLSIKTSFLLLLSF